MPAALAARAHATGSYRSGSKWSKYGRYCSSVSFSRLCTHSCRAASEYSPQWTNRPNRSWVNHAVLVELTEASLLAVLGSESVGVGQPLSAPEASPRTNERWKNRNTITEGSNASSEA